MKIIALGGAGDMGRRAVRDLAERNEVEGLMIADYNVAGAQQLAQELGGGKVQAMPVDANDATALVEAIRPYDVAMSSIGPFYRFEAKVAQAAIDAEAHYVSLCDDYDAAAAVLELDAAAKEKERSVLTGLGWTPGLSNVLARKGCDQLDQVEEINVAWGSSASEGEGYAVILHTLHIFTGLVPSFQGGQLISVPAGSGQEKVRFPEPVGEMDVYHLGHPEPVTLPRFIQGLQTVTLKGGLSEGFLNGLARFLGRAGLTNSPRKKDFIGKIIKATLPVLNRLGKPENPCSAVRVDVRGKKAGEPAHQAYGAAAHMDDLTGLPLAVGALMLGRGDITARGVIAPEVDIAPDPFLAELAARNLRVLQGDDMALPLGWEQGA